MYEMHGQSIIIRATTATQLNLNNLQPTHGNRDRAIFLRTLLRIDTSPDSGPNVFILSYLLFTSNY